MSSNGIGELHFIDKTINTEIYSNAFKRKIIALTRAFGNTFLVLKCFKIYIYKTEQYSVGTTNRKFDRLL